MKTTFDRHTLVIGLCGHAKAGKDTTFKGIEKYFFQFSSISRGQIAFADPIREIGLQFGFTWEELTDQNLKEKINPFWQITPRKFMQLVGSEMFRKNLSTDCWVRLAQKRILDSIKCVEKREDLGIGINHVIFITDVRFENEAKMIKDIGGYIFKINRPSLSTDPVGIKNHESEAAVDKIPYDLEIINNSGSAEEYEVKANREWFAFLSSLNPVNLKAIYEEILFDPKWHPVVPLTK